MRRIAQLTLYVVLVIALLSIQFNNFSFAFSTSSNVILDNETSKRVVMKQDDSWIVKWKNNAHHEFLKTSQVISYLEEVGVYVVRPVNEDLITEWLDRWSADPEIEYFHYNQKVNIEETPNDKLFSDQDYLQQIHVNDAWDVSTENTSIIIAIIDTGIDLEHPDLKDNLIPGANLLKYGQLPQDDHGHGTNVAGVIAAIGNNEIGVSGLLWNASIMPVKAMDEEGEGEEGKLGEAILYGVDNGAKIIVLSVGLFRFSPFLKEVSEYAESKGVLLIASTGNEGNEVKYPAAYPTVFAVGAVGPDNRVMLESNYGPEIDIVAPWRVYTTALGGGYRYNQGTSMSSPQVAGVAALLWSKYPDMKPIEIRNQLRQTADDIESKGWDPYSGYGLLRADRALRETSSSDIYEPNNVSEQASKLPLDTMIIGELTSGLDEDWFYIDSNYEGKVDLEFEYMDAFGPSVSVTHYVPQVDKETIYEQIDEGAAQIQVSKGRSRLLMKYGDLNERSTHRYRLTTTFRIYADHFEDNDQRYKAYSLSSKSGIVNGTFHQVNDQDWFSFEINSIGSLSVSIDPDTVRMDVALLLMKPTGEHYIKDHYGEGIEETIIIDVTPGRYYLLVSNLISEEAFPVKGEYALEYNFLNHINDPNEPNNKYFQATPYMFNSSYKGLIDNIADEDWYKFYLDSDSYITLELRGIPESIVMSMSLLDNKLNQMFIIQNTVDQKEVINEQVIPKGTYYVKLDANQRFIDAMYQIHIHAEPLVAGFQDIKGHWAEQSIISLVNQSIVSGYGNNTFQPNRYISRGEAVLLISKAIGLRTATNINFTDVSTMHWAYDSIRGMAGAGIVTGYSDNTFRPDQSITRAEMSVMIAKTLRMTGSPNMITTYSDVPNNYWAAPWINQLQYEGYVNGYWDGRFEPEEKATRAEFATLLLGALAS